MIFEVNFKSGMPAYLQIVDQVKLAAASGTIRPGESLPGIRTLAEQLRVNRNTIAKAYAELEGQGIVDSQPGKGCFIRNNGESPLKKKPRLEMVAKFVDTAIVQAWHLKITEDEFIELVRQRFQELSRRQNQSSSAKSYNNPER